MYRAFRVDKLIIEALETTLRHLLTENWQRHSDAPDDLRRLWKRSANAPSALRESCKCLNAAVRQSESAIGGGSTPDQTLPTWVIELTVPNAERFRAALASATRAGDRKNRA